jgi:hypothetical protein
MPEKRRVVPKSVFIDEFHVTITAPRGLPQADYDAIRQALDDKQFQADLHRRVTAVFRKHLPLSKARLKITR